MTTTTITMTDGQTPADDSDDDDVSAGMIRQLRQQAGDLLAGAVTRVEIHTADGVVADVVERDEPAAPQAFDVGTRVEAGVGEDHDTGVVAEPGVHALAMNRAADAVWVRWDSGSSTWTPPDLLTSEG